MSSRFSSHKSSSEFRRFSKEKANRNSTQIVCATASSPGRKSKNQAFALSSTAFSVCIALSSYSLPAIINPALANGPKGAVVVGGSGDITKVDAATTLINQSSQHMAINWDSYNVAANETVRYVQPNASAISLNRILGVNGSTIAGQIQSNGQVILINPNGLVFTDTAVLNVGGIIASGLDMSTSDFMNGDYIFNELTYDGADGTAANGMVINRGLINASLGGTGGGNVALIGKQVVNEGLIEASLGSVTLAAGKQAVLTFDAGGVLGVKVSKEILQEELGVDPALINSGEINAQGGRVLLTASTSQDIFSQAVNSGLEQATSVVVHDDGSFTLGGGADVVNSGKIDVSSHTLDFNTSGAGQIVVIGENITSSGEILANGNSFNAGDIEIHAQDTLLITEQSLISARSDIATGGDIIVLGDKIALLDDSIIDASGETAGGEILIGGDYRGENELIRNASASYIAGNTHINADALNSGDGGKVIIWSNDSAKVYGNISATGGLINGDGGFVETSAEVIDLSLNVNVSASQGASGTWLIDPFNITIDDVANDVDIDDSQTPTAPITKIFTNNGNDSTLDVTTLYAALTSGAHVKIQTSDAGGAAEPAGGNITLDTQFDLELKSGFGDVSLTLEAHHNININQDILDSNGGDGESISLNFIANSNGLNGGDVNINANINTRGGSLSASGDNITISASQLILTEGGSVDLNALNSVSLNDASITTSSGNIVISDASIGIDFGTSTINTGGGNLEIFDTSVGVNAGGGVNFNGSNISTEGGNIIVFDALDVDTATGAVDFGSSIFDTAGGNVTLNSTSGIVALNSAAITTQGGSFISAASASVSTISSSIVTSGGENLDGGEINITTSGALSVDTLTANGGTANRNGGNGVVGRAGGDITLTSDSNNITVNQDMSTVGTTGHYRNSNPVGQNGGLGGSIIITANTGLITTTSIITDGAIASGDSNDSANGGDAGSIDLAASNIVTNGDISSVGGQGVGSSGEGGDGNDVTLTANSLVLNNDFDARVGSGGNQGSSAGTTEGAVNVIISGDAGSATIGHGAVFTTVVNVAQHGSATGSQTLTSSSIIDGLEWYIDGAGNGHWQLDSDGSALNLVFTGIENVTGGVNADVFNITETGSVAGIIDGGSGTNTLERSNSTGSNTWLIDGTDTGTLNGTRFNKIQILTGSTVDDDYSFTSVSANVDTINGGTGNNTLTARDADNEWHLTSANGGVLYQDNAGAGFGTAYVDNFTDIQTLIGSDTHLDNFVMATGSSIASIDGGSDVNNSLTARDTDNEWDVSGTNSGILYQDNSGAGFGTSYVDNFSNIQSLIGSDANADIFVMASGASISGIDGGIDGNNTLIADDIANEWHITAANTGVLYQDNAGAGYGTSYVDGFSNVQHLKGSESFLDIFVMATGSSLKSLDGGGDGNNILTARDADNEWHLTSANGGVLYQDNAGAGFGTAYVDNFTDIQTLIGSDTHLDNFVMATGSSIASIDGGSDVNNSLTARDTDNEWDVSGTNSGILYQDNSGAGFGTSYVDNFSNIQSLIGSDANLDIFVMGATGNISNIDGGTDGNNTLIARQGVTNTWGFTSLTSGSLTQLTPLELYVDSFSNIKTFVGGGAGGEWADLSGISSAVDVGNYFSFTGIIGNGTNSELVGQDGVTNTWQIDSVVDADSNATEGLNDGTFSNVNGSLLFIDFVTLTGGSSTDNFTIANTGSFNGTINGGLGTNTLKVKDAAINTWAITSSGAGSVNDASTVFNFTDMDNLIGGINVDNFTLTDISHVSGLIDGGAGLNDSVTINANGQTVILGTDITNIESVSALAGSNTLQATDVDNTWAINTADTGTLSFATETLAFTNFSDLVGGSADDSFSLATMNLVSGLMDGAGGTNDSVTLTTANQTVVIGSGVSGIEILNGAVGSNTLQANDVDNTWVITGNDQGTVANLTFTNFSDLVGGDADDNFTLDDITQISGLIDGGTWIGSDSVTLNANNQTVILGTDITNIESVSALAGSNSLQATDVDNTWAINTTDTGTLSFGANTLAFTNFSDLVGGSADDSFSLATMNLVSGLMDGSGGTNDSVTLSVANQTVVVGSGISNIEVFNAAVGSNTLQANDVANTWVITGNDEGTVANMTFTNFSSLVGGNNTDTFALDDISQISGLIDGGAGTSDSVTINANGQTVILGTDITNIESVSAVAGSNTLQATDVDNTWAINTADTGILSFATETLAFTNFSDLVGGSADDSFSLATMNLVSGLMDGAGGTNDSVTLTTANQTIMVGSGITGIETFNAAVGTNTLQGNDVDNTWVITGNDQGTVANLTFTNFSDLVGGSADDNFTLDDITQISGLIDGGSGSNDSVIFTAGNQSVNLSTDITEIETLTGFATGNSLSINDGINFWTVNSNNGGDVAGVDFTDFENLQGGSGQDFFTVTAAITSLNSGGGNDDITVDNLALVATTIDAGTGTGDKLSLVDASQTINLNDITGFEVLEGALGSNTLQGSNTDNTWIIDNDNQGTVNDGTNTLSFSNFTDIEGGDLIDIFTITAAINSLNGGSGEDKITVRELSDVTNIIDGGDDNDTVTLTNDGQTVNISNAVIGVETIIGSATGSNILQANGAINTWLVGGANQGSVDDGATFVNFENFTDLEGGSQTDNFTVSATGSVDSIKAGAGTDSVFLNTVSSVNDTNPQIALDGGAGDDSLTVNSSGNIWAFSTDEDGSVTNGGISREFTDFETQGSAVGSSDTFDYSGYAGPVTVNLNTATGVGVVIGNLNDTSTLIGTDGTTNEWLISQVTSSDGVNDGSVTENGTTVIFRDFNVLTGGDNIDNFTITDTGTFDGTINGGLGTNTLTGQNSDNTWVIDTDNAGSLSYSTITTHFTDIANVVGGSAVDNFTLSANLNSLNAGANNDIINLDDINRVTEAIDGDDGDDTVNISGTDQLVNLASDIIRVENLIATGSNTLQSGDSTNTWHVNSTNSGTFSDNVTLVNFTNFNELLGGSGVDTITLTANIDSLDTGGGDDIINVDILSRVTNSIDGGTNNDTLNISLGNQTIELGNGFTGIETLNGTGSNTLQGSDSNNTWAITGTNSGTVNDGVNLISFNNFSTLIGGNLTDNFTLADMDLVAGLIDGGVGTDSVKLTTVDQTVVLGTDITNIEQLTASVGANTLQADDIDNTWLITGDEQGTVAGTTFSNFSDLIGGSADDSFTLAAINQISGTIDGGGGNNTVTLTTADQHIILDTDIKQIDNLVAAIGSNTLQAADVANTWTITDNGTGSVDGVNFSNISDLIGGSAVDSFTLSSIDQISGVIDGGAGSDNLTLTTAEQTVTLSTDIRQLENLTATTGTLIAHNEANTWAIDSSDGGTITNSQGTVSFKGFANLTGGSDVDSFTISGASGDISGLINGAGGSDSLVLSSIHDQVIELGSDITTNLNVDQIESITANKDATNTLLADDVENIWLVDDNESGVIAYSGISTIFSNFEHLIGGTDVDKFTISAGGVTSIVMGSGNDVITSSGGNVALVNGNDGDDTFTLSGGSLETMQGDGGSDYIAYTEDDVAITLGDNIVGFEAISATQGNGTISAQDDVTTTWTIDEENKGEVIDSSTGSSSLTFSGFANINGGSGIDNFIVNDNGAITGFINGGASSDTLTVNLDSSTRTQTGVINFNGGTGDDEVTITGSANKFAESYHPNVQIDTEQYDQLTFAKNSSTVSVDINYRNVVSVNDTIETTSLQLNNGLDSDLLSISNTSFGADSALVNVTFSAENKGDITVAADSSNLIVTDTLTIDGDLTINANTVTQTAGTITTQQLILDDVTLMGSASDGLEVSVEELLIQNHSGEIYLNEHDDITLTSLSNTSGLVTINSETGAISASNILTSSGGLDLTAATDINLEAQNQLTGVMTLSAGGNVILNNDAATNISALTATNAKINSADSITVSGDINVVSSDTANDLPEGVLALTATLGDINLDGHTQANTIDITTANDINLASVSAEKLNATATSGDITASGSVIVKQVIPGVSTTLSAENGVISFESSSNDFDGVSLIANSAVITDQNGLGLTLAELASSLIVNANGDVALGTMTAGESIAIDAGAGTIVSQESNVSTPQLTLRASTGIGSGIYDEVIVSNTDNSNAINTNTANLSVINSTSGIVNINNSQAVTIADLRNNGDIILVNTGDMTLQVSQVDGAATGAVNGNYGQDVTNEVYSGKVALLNSGEDSIYTTGLGLNEADITAESLLVNSVANFGSASQPIRLRVNENFTLLGSLGTLASINYFGGEPRVIITSEGLTLQVISTITGLSGQQLVEVESLDDVDPAIFADVRNYNVDDTSVLLPRDQRSGDEEEREEGEE